MNTPTNSISFTLNESPRSDLSSSFESSLIRWKRTPEKTLSREYDEYGQIDNLETTEPFVIKFYNVASGARAENGYPRTEIACQFDDFIEVPISEAVKCLECLTDDRILLDSVEIEINVCTPRSKLAIENVLRKFAERRERCKEIVMIKRLVFFIYDFTYAKELAPILADLAPRVYEMNLGIAKRKVYDRLPPAQEAKYVAEFMHEFLCSRNAWETIRVLRIFYFVSLDPYLQKSLKKCARLRHLTLSNIDDIMIFELESVESVLLDSCDNSITMVDESFSDKHPRLFPRATTFGFLRCPMDLVTRALKQWSMDRIADSRKELYFFQPERDFRRFLFEATKSFEMLNDDKELEGEVQIRGHSGGPLITVFNKDRVYKARIQNE
uniref:Uncharacterized protein n=1 Tax=Caenorhabditis japonica TaxID=281687 RepID=A0A8R1I4W6_CAEJA